MMHISRLLISGIIFAIVTAAGVLGKFFDWWGIQAIQNPLATMTLYAIGIGIILLPWSGRNVKGFFVFLIGVIVAAFITYAMYL